MSRLTGLLKSGAFLTRQRALLWAGAVLLGTVAALLVLALTAHGINDYDGRPLGTDFSNVYAAGRAALAGDATAPFDIARQGRAEQAIFGAHTQLYGWHYPPVFLLIAAPLARLSYIPALLLWQGATLLLYLGAMALLLRTRRREWLLPALGFPAVFVNLIHGQNGFLTAALFGFGLALLERRPLLAGLAFGLVCYKPQYGVLIPLALAAGGCWRAFLAAAVTVLVAALAATLCFGAAIWPAFLDSLSFTRVVVLEQGNTGFHKMASIFAWARLWGGSVAMAYAAQGALALLSALVVIALWRRGASPALKGAALCLAAILGTPYAMDYDLMLLAPAIALLARDGRARGFADWDLLALALLWALPGLARPLAQHLLLPLAVPAMLFALWRIARRAQLFRPDTIAMPLRMDKSPTW